MYLGHLGLGSIRVVEFRSDVFGAGAMQGHRPELLGIGPFAPGNRLEPPIGSVDKLPDQYGFLIPLLGISRFPQSSTVLWLYGRRRPLESDFPHQICRLMQPILMLCSPGGHTLSPALG